MSSTDKQVSRVGLSKKNLWAFAAGSTGRDMAYTLVSMFLLLYIQYTVKLTVQQFTTISILMVVSLIWDAINDPIMGIIIENTNFKWGKYKPWILSGAILNSIVIFLLFNVRPEGWGFVAFFGVFYLLWGMTFTMNDISYYGLLPSLSSDSKERNALVTLMSIFVSFGQFSVAAIVPIVAAGNAVKHYGIVALCVALAFTLFQAMTAIVIEERPRKNLSEKVTLKRMFEIFKRNDQLVIAGIATVVFNVGANLLILFALNFVYVEFGYSKGGGMATIFTVMYGLGTLFAQFSFSILNKKFTRSKILSTAVAFLILGYLSLLSFGYILPKNPIIMYITAFVIFFCQGLYNMMILVMINNTIEYDEWKYGSRHDSVISAVRSFGVKLATAINQLLVVITLVLSGIYSITQEVSELEVQVGRGALASEEALVSSDKILSTVEANQALILRLGMTVIPIIAISTAYYLFTRRYKIDEVFYEQIVEDLESKK